MLYEKEIRKYYILQSFIGTILPAVYILWVTGVFSDGVYEEGIQTSIILVFLFVSFKIIKDFKRRAMHPDNKNYKQKAIAIALFSFLPWLMVLGLLAAVHFGVAGLYRHATVIVFLQAVSKFFLIFEEYYTMKQRAGK